MIEIEIKHRRGSLIELIAELLAFIAVFGFILWMIFGASGFLLAFSNYNRDPSGSPAESPVTVTINNNGDCGGYGGYTHSWWLDLLDDGATHWYYQHQDMAADADIDFTVQCGDTVCNSITNDTCNSSSELSCDVDFTHYGIRCGDGGGAGATTEDAWTLTTGGETPTATSTTGTVTDGGTLAIIWGIGLILFLLGVLVVVTIWR